MDKKKINKPKNEGDLSNAYVLGNYGYQNSYTVLDDWGEPVEKTFWEQYYILLENGHYVISDGMFNVAKFNNQWELLDFLGNTYVKWTVDIENWDE